MNEIEILFENNDVLVINKPVGLSVHSENANASGTLVEWFLAQVPDALGVGEPKFDQDGKEIERSGIVHRLDKDTSGVMIMAKNQEAFLFLKDQFKNRRVKKEYRALVYGLLHERWGTIDRPIGRSAKDFRLRSAQRGAKGKLRDAVTDWERIGQGEYEDETFSYLKLMPKTGRTHQLRVHLKAVDRPIVGDVLYAGKKLALSSNLGLERLALHAHILELDLPKGEAKRFVAPMSEELIEAIDKMTE